MSRNTIHGTSADQPEQTPSPLLKPHAGTTQPSDPGRASLEMNVVIAWILQGGVLLSSAIICVGLALLFVHPEQLSGQNALAFPHTLGQVRDGLLGLRPQAFVAVGLLLLIATPVMRVAISILAFAKEHDRRYVVITTIVLAILITSFLLGKGGG